MLNGLLLFGAEALRRRAPRDNDEDDARIARQVAFRHAFLVGAAQALALIPGFSRSGATMGGGLLVGLSNMDAARFSFLLATPDHSRRRAAQTAGVVRRQGDGIRGQALVASLCAAGAAFLASAS